MTARLAVAAIGVIAIWSAGCGGDDATTSSVTSSTTTGAGGVSKDEFITAADARCAEANAAIANLTSDGSGSSTALQQQEDITKQTLKGLQALGKPDDPDGSLSDYYVAVKEQISVLGQQQSALASGDSATVESLSVQLDQAESDAQTAGESFGFDECGQSGTAISDTTTGAPSDVAPTTTATTPPATTTTPVPTTTTPAPVTPPPSGAPSGGTSSGGTSGGSSGGSGSSGGISPGG